MRGAGVIVAAAMPVSSCLAARPRGVGPDFAKFYQDLDTFTCISDPAVRIPYSQVNDDYCDCPDGSDEPGTSACAFLSSNSPSYPSDPTSKDTVNASIALPGFYCKNKGHRPSYVAFTRVNDGVCDYSHCCDGSDEWMGVGGIKCQDRCAVIGEEARKLAESQAKSLNAAVKARNDLILQAARLRKRVETEIAETINEIAAEEQKLVVLEKELIDAEHKERSRVISGAVNKNSGKLGVLVSLAQKRTKELRDHLIRVRDERDANAARVAELERILANFKEEYNPNFNDEGVKRAVRAWEDYATKDKSVGANTLDQDLNEIVKSDEENGVAWDDFTQVNEEPETALLYNFEAYLPPSLRTWLDESLRSLRIRLVDAGILAEATTSASGGVGESKFLSDARARVKSSNDQLTNLRNSQTGLTEDLNKDYGSGDIFRALKGRCVAVDSGEYTYEMCYMDHTAQKSRKGGSETRMGQFSRFETVTVDDEMPADGRGLGSGERLAMRFENGQTCWNGPARSTLAILACAEKNEVWKVVEEEKCVYRMEVGTPAVCGDRTRDAPASGASGAGDPHKQEL